MTVGELRLAIADLPDDMPVACTETHLTSGMAAAVIRYHFAARWGTRRYCEGLWIGWSGSSYKYEITLDGRAVDRGSGYSPELQTVLHDDGESESQPKWPITEEEAS